MVVVLMMMMMMMMHYYSHSSLRSVSICCLSKSTDDGDNQYNTEKQVPLPTTDRTLEYIQMNNTTTNTSPPPIHYI